MASKQPQITITYRGIEFKLSPELSARYLEAAKESGRDVRDLLIEKLEQYPATTNSFLS